MAEPRSNKTRLLIVEDEQTDALLLHKALSSHVTDATIELASSGAEALKYLGHGESPAEAKGEWLPKLILMDLKLPGLSGFEVLERVKSTDGLKEIPIVVLTSSSDAKDVRRAFAAGANSYLVKPNTFSGSVALTGHIVHYWLALDRRAAA